MSNLEVTPSSEEVDEQKKYRDSQSDVKVSFGDYAVRGSEDLDDGADDYRGSSRMEPSGI